MEAISLIFRRLAGFPNTLKITSPPSLAQPGRAISEALRGMKGTLGAHDHFRVKTFRDFDDLHCPGRDSNPQNEAEAHGSSSETVPKSRGIEVAKAGPDGPSAESTVTLSHDDVTNAL